MTSRLFTRKMEDFTCGNCGAAVTGDGYTNHCPRCLYSCHVDVNPGDRAESCGGLMAPVALSQKNGRYVIVHRCLKCGAERPNRAHDADDPAALIALARALAEEKTK